MTKLQIIMGMIQLFKMVMSDKDNDGRIDLFDSEPLNPDVQ